MVIHKRLQVQTHFNSWHMERINAYKKKYKELYGPESDPASQDLDCTVSAMPGEGNKGGRLYVGDSAIPKKDIPKLSHLRATMSSTGPAIERRPQPGLHLLHQFQARLEEETRLRQEAKENVLSVTPTAARGSSTSTQQ